MVLKALELELALLAHTFATVLVCTPYLDCICVTHDGLGTTRESSMAARVFSSGHTLPPKLFQFRLQYYSWFCLSLRSSS